MFYVKYNKLSPKPDKPGSGKEIMFTDHMVYLAQAGSGIFFVICLLALTIAPPLGKMPVLGMEVTKPPWQFVWIYALENLWVPTLIVAPVFGWGLFCSFPFSTGEKNSVLISGL